MNLWKIALRSIQSRSVASLLTCFSMALGVTLVVSVLVINSVVAETFNRNPGMGYDLVVGKKGGDYQLVLNTLFHLSRPVENLPYSYYKEFVSPEGKFKSLVSRAIPYCLGDNFQGFRVVGTVPGIFDPDFEYGPGRKYEFAEGRNFKQSEFFEGVVGATVARETGLRVGDTFSPTHSFAEDGHVHDDQFTVVGILKPTGTPNDRALFINMEGFYLMDNHAAEEKPPAAKDDHAGHDHGKEDHGNDHGKEPAKKADEPKAEEKKADAKSGCESEPEETAVLLAYQAAKDTGHEHAGHDHGHSHDHSHAHAPREPLPESQREVTAILVRGLANNPMAGMMLARNINKGTEAQAASPVRVVTGLFATFVDPLRMLLIGMAVLVVLVAGIGVLVNIYNSMNERRREVAVMRALGARRTTVFQIILLESILLSLFGGIAGWLMGHGLTWLIGWLWLADTAGVTVNFWQLVNVDIGSSGSVKLPLELLLVGGLVGLASIVGYLPAMAAYKTDVAKCLANSP